MTDIDTSRGPWHAMIDRQALALQAQTGESYASAFTKCYTAPENASIRDNATYEHLAQGHDAIFGTRLSMIPVAKAAPAYDPLRKAAEIAESYGPAHAKMHSLAIDHQRARGPELCKRLQLFVYPSAKCGAPREGQSRTYARYNVGL
jgi:hypothetical protein